MLTISRLLLASTATLALAACHRGDGRGAAAAGNNDVKLGTFRVVLQRPGGELPFGLELKETGSGLVRYLINGQERLLLSDVKITGSHLEIRMPGYENLLTTDAAGNELQGEVFLVKPNGKNQHVPLRATLGENYRFFAKAASGDKAAGEAADVSGRWAGKFIDDSGAPEVADAGG